MPLSSQAALIVVVAGLSKFTFSLLKVGQTEAAKVWNMCRDAQQPAIEERAKWPHQDMLQKLTKRRFCLHSQSAQMVCHAFPASVKTTVELRKQGRKDIRAPHKEKRFHPLLWPAQAMALDGNRIILPMGRGRKPILLPRPEWLTKPSACKIIWNRIGYELHVTAEAEIAEPSKKNVNATVDPGQIHPCAVTTDPGKGLIVSGRGIRPEKRRLNQIDGSLASKLCPVLNPDLRSLGRLSALSEADLLQQRPWMRINSPFASCPAINRSFLVHGKTSKQ
jgi:putative transposase